MGQATLQDITGNWKIWSGNKKSKAWLVKIWPTKKKVPQASKKHRYVDIAKAKPIVPKEMEKEQKPVKVQGWNKPFGLITYIYDGECMIPQKYGKKIVWHNARDFQKQILIMVPASMAAVKKAKSTKGKEGKKMVKKFWYANKRLKSTKKQSI